MKTLQDFIDMLTQEDEKEKEINFIVYDGQDNWDCEQIPSINHYDSCIDFELRLSNGYKVFYNKNNCMNCTHLKQVTKTCTPICGEYSFVIPFETFKCSSHKLKSSKTTTKLHDEVQKSVDEYINSLKD